MTKVIAFPHRVGRLLSKQTETSRSPAFQAAIIGDLLVAGSALNEKVGETLAQLDLTGNCIDRLGDSEVKFVLRDLEVALRNALVLAVDGLRLQAEILAAFNSGEADSAVEAAAGQTGMRSIRGRIASWVQWFERRD